MNLEEIIKTLENYNDQLKKTYSLCISLHTLDSLIRDLETRRLVLKKEINNNGLLIRKDMKKRSRMYKELLDQGLELDMSNEGHSRLVDLEILIEENIESVLKELKALENET